MDAVHNALSNTSITDGYLNIVSQQCMIEVSSKPLARHCYRSGISPEVLSRDSNKVASIYGVTLYEDLTYDSGMTALSKASLYTSFFRDLYLFRTYISIFGVAVPVLLSAAYLCFFLDSSTMAVAIRGGLIGSFCFLAVGSWLLWSTAAGWQGDGFHSKGDHYCPL